MGSFADALHKNQSCCSQKSVSIKDDQVSFQTSKYRLKDIVKGQIRFIYMLTKPSSSFLGKTSYCVIALTGQCNIYWDFYGCKNTIFR